MTHISELINEFKNETDPAKKDIILDKIEKILDAEVIEMKEIQKALIRKAIELHEQRNTDERSFFKPINW